MKRRLVKIAKEMNVGLSTIVDFLQGKGFEIESKPTANVSEEMYQELSKEFQRSIAIKEQADSMIIGTRPSRKEELEVAEKAVLKPIIKPVAPPPPPVSTPKVEIVEPAPKVEQKPEVKETIVKPTIPEVPKIKVVEPVAPVAPVAPKEDQKAKPALKILGKIDLDKDKKRKAAAKQQKEVQAKEVTPVKETPPVKPTPEVTEKAPEKPKEQPVSKPVVETPAKPVSKPVVKTPAKKEVVTPKVTQEPTAKKVEKPVTVEKTTPQTSKVSSAPSDISKAPKEGGLVRAKTPELRGLKILGKIDASKLGSGRGRKSKDKKEADKNKKPTQGQAGSSEGAKRRRRKRKKISGGNTTGGGGGTGRPQQQRSGGRAGGNQRGGTRRGPVKKRDEVKEVSQKEIEDKIKATMARMAGRGGKKKRQKIRRDNRERLREKQEQRDAATQTDKLQVTEFISVQELANLMDVSATEVIMTCMNLGVIVSINQRLDAEVIELVAEEFEHEVEFISVEDEQEEEEEYIDDPADLRPRAAVVTIMGHVDHGKTSLLDYIRNANVADGEAGGITQHIGAYEVSLDGDKDKTITFLDTPGHEAFTAMRARGAKVTDIAVIIIAADDSIMPQTKEAISHAEAAGVPIIFAINKIDKAGANIDKIKQELGSMNYLIEEWGGKYGSADISAKNGTNIDVLLERIQLEAEIQELKANPNRPAAGTVLEASLDKGRGYITKMLVNAGTLKIGDSMVSGEHSGRVKAMFNERNERVKEAGPSTPVLVLGLGGAPQAGERFKIVATEQEAREIANRRGQIAREQANRATKRISLDEIGRRLALGSFKELNLIVKGDVDGSVEALSDSLIKLSQETVQVNVIHRAVGQIIESDVLLGTASDAIIIGFQVRPSAGARKLAEREGVQIKTYSIIYEVIDEIKLAIEGMLDTIKEEKVLGQIEVKQVFKISKVGTVAGCQVLEGKILRDSHVRLIRDGIVVYPLKEGVIGEINALRRFKDDVKEVRAGMECGLSIKKYNDIKVGDIVEAYEITETKQKLKM